VAANRFDFVPDTCLLSEGARNEQVMVALCEEIDQASMFEEIVGHSPAIQHCFV